MKITAKARYGLIALLDMAVYTKETHVPLYAIAKRNNIPLKYLEQVFALLRSSNLVRSVKGSQGGYTLSKPAREILVSDVLKALLGDIGIADTEVTDKAASETTAERCLRENIVAPINTVISKCADSITLADLAESYTQLSQSGAEMYYI